VLVAAVALAMPYARELVRAVYGQVVDPEGSLLLAQAARGIAVLGLLTLPALAMGATLPVVVAAWHRNDATGAETAAGVGFLYGASTVGAVAGALLAGFVLLPRLGLVWTARCAAAVDVLAALIAWRLARPVPPAAPPALAASVTPERRLVGLYAAAGFLTLATQLLWTRLLALHLRGVTYTFTAILAVFIAGLALGDLLAAVWVRRRGAGWARGRFGLLQALAGLALLLAWVAIPVLGDLRVWVEHLVPVRGTASHALNLVAPVVVYLLGPCVLLGTLFPLAVAGLVPEPARAPGAAGRLYAAGSVGGAAGALVGGLLLVPTVGLLQGVALVALAMVGLGSLALLRRRSAAGLLAAGLLATAMVLWQYGPDAAHSPLGDTPVFRSSHAWGRVEVPGTHRQGVAAIVTVIDDQRTGDRVLYTDEFAATSTASSAAYMRLLGHLPMLAAEQPATALVLCYGTGTTAGSVATHETLERLDIVEISHDVLEVSPCFSGVNRDVLEDPRVHVFVQDGRDFLATSRRRWDVISLEPLLPTTPQAVHFYTVEFYREAQAHLREGGVLCQWSPVHAMAVPEFRGLVRSFTDVFGETATLWFFEESVLLLGGETGALTPASLTARLAAAAPAVREDLQQLGLDRAPALLGCCVLDERGLTALVTGARPVSDDRPWIEFYTHHGAAGRLGHLAGTLEALLAAAGAQGGPALGEAPAWEGTGLTLAGRARARRGEILARQGQGRAALAEYREALGLLEEAASRRPGDPLLASRLEATRRQQALLEGQEAMGVGDTARALERFQAAAAGGEDPDALLNLGAAERRAGLADAATTTLDQLLARYPRCVAGWVERARLRDDLGDAAGAEQDRQRAEELQAGRQ
jgi:spermidine synthase